MSKLLSIPVTPDVPVACDMTTAEDSLVDRKAEYRRLFGDALVSRDVTATTTTFRFADRPGVRDRVVDLVRREAACCPFLAYDVDAEGGEVVWTTTGLGASDLAVLEEFIDDPGPAGEDSEAMARRLTELGGVPVIVPRGR
jgi:hypothetical protein